MSPGSVMTRLVRRWGARSVGLVLTAIGLYVVAPGLLALFGSWPRLRDVEPWWFVVLIVLVGLSMASMWWLTRLALRRPAGPDGTHRTISWSTAATAHLAGDAAGKIVPGGPATAGGGPAPTAPTGPSRGARRPPPTWPGTPRARSSRAGRPRRVSSRPRSSSTPARPRARWPRR